MTHSVYIIQSELDHTFYKGYSTDVEKRLLEHNEGLSSYTSRKTPWKLVFIKNFETKREALIFELRIKKYNSDYLKKMIAGSENDYKG